MPDTAAITDDLNLSDEKRGTIDRILVQRINAATTGAQTRNDDLADMEDQLEGRSYPVGMPWANAATLNDPASLEVYLQIVPMLMQSFKTNLPWVADAVNPDDDEDAAVVEEFLADKYAEYNMHAEWLYGLASNAVGRDNTAVGYVGWRQQIRETSEITYRDSQQDFDNDDDGWMTADERDPDRLEDYDEKEVFHPEAVNNGCEFRVVDQSNLYLYPANATSLHIEKPGGAQGVGERMMLSEDALLDGIEDYGWNEDAVLAMIAHGPTHDAEYGELQSRQDETAGVSGNLAEAADGYYDCYLYFGRLPKLREADGTIGIDKSLVRGDVMAMICPAHNTVFHLVKSPYSRRPYFGFSMLPKPNRFEGRSAMSLIQPMQEEANYMLQDLLNGLSLTRQPVLSVTSDWLSYYGDRFKVYPGAKIPRDLPDDIKPLEWGGNQNLSLQVLEGMQQRTKGLLSAVGLGQLDNKVRKNNEIQNVLQGADNKFEFFLDNFLQEWPAVGEFILALHLQFGGEDASWQFRGRDKKGKEITADQMRKKFRILSAATAATSSPEMRLQIAEKKQNVGIQYWAGVLQVPVGAPPEVASTAWHGARTTLYDLGERVPENYIGKEPQQNLMPPQEMAMIAQLPPQLVMQTLMPLIQQMQMQQAMQQQAQQQGGAASPAGAGGAPQGIPLAPAQTPPMPGIAQLAQQPPMPMPSAA